MLNASQQLDVLDAFKALTQSLDVLNNCIRQDVDIVAWAQTQDESSTQTADEREKIISVINQLQYHATQTPREIIVCAGFVGASENTLEAARAVNQCKETFKQQILALKAAKLSVNDPPLLSRFSEILLRAPSVSLTLKNTGLSRLHLKQCYRKIPILDAVPSKISWTWAHTRSIKKISLEMAKVLLEKRGNDTGIDIQLHKLGTLKPNESLAIVQELAPHLRANIVFHTEEGDKRIMIKGPIPIFFPATHTTPYPDFTPPQQKRDKNKNRHIRSDVKLDPMVFLPAIRAHRYLR